MAILSLMRRLILLPVLVCCILAAVFGSGTQAQEAPPRRPTHVTGQVVDLSGEVLAGVRVVGSIDPRDELAALDPDPIPPVRATTDPTGGFDLDWPDRLSRRDPASIWVFREGYRLGRVAVPPGAVREPIRLRLAPVSTHAGAALQVVGPQGKPIAGARVVPTRWFEGDMVASSAKTWEIPPLVGDQLALRTDARGQVLFDSLAALRLAAVAVVDPDFGRQVIHWDETLSPRHRDVWLRPVGRIVGQVHANDPADCAGGKVKVLTSVGSRPVGLGFTTVDPTGHFAIESIAAGSVAIEVEAPPGSMVLPAPVRSQTLEPGQTLTIDVPTHPGVRLTGRVLDRTHAKPVAGATMILNGPGPASRTTQTDAVGRFAAIVAPGAITAVVETAPPPFLVSTRAAHPQELMVSPEIDHFEWPTIQLDPGITIRGRVFDQNQQPITIDAVVEVRWTRRDGRAHDEMIVTRPTGPNGRFAVGPIPDDVELHLRVHSPAGSASKPVQIASGHNKDAVQLVLPTPDRLVAPTGRVIDAAGRPVAGALVQFRVVDSDNAAQGPRPGRRIAADGLEAVVTDDQGFYEGAARLDPRRSYLASAEAADCESGRTRPVAQDTTNNHQLHFPDLVLDRHQVQAVLVGRVTGSDGQPIAGVTIHDLAHHRVATDAAGWFRLEKIGDNGTAFLFASKPGYRFLGRSLAFHRLESPRTLTLELIRQDEPQPNQLGAGAADAAVPRLVTDLLIQAMVINPFVERTLAHRDLVNCSAILEDLAREEPRRVLDWLDAGVIHDRRIADGLRRIAARNLVATDQDAATTAAQRIEERSTRILASLEMVGKSRLITGDQKRSTVTRLTGETRSIEDLTQRGLVLARVAESWLDLAESDQARQCLNEAQAIAEILPRATTGAKVWCALIGPMAQLDPDCARARLSHLVDPADLDRCRLAIALRLARLNPTEAIATFRRIRDPKIAARATAEICYRLAPVALPEAEDLIQRIKASHPSTAAHALGMMASSLAGTNRAAAVRLLHEAYDRLEALAQADALSAAETDLSPAIIAAVLLPTVERVEPSSLFELFWKSVALQSAHSSARPQSTAILALLLDRYDRDVARHLFDPGRIHYPLIAPGEFSPLVLATAQIAPEVACQWVHSRRELTAGSQLPPPDPDQTHLEIVADLTATDLDRWHRATNKLLHLWTPDGLLPVH